MQPHTPSSTPITDIRAQLKKSHQGIDEAIDRLLDAVKPWQLFAQAQTRPRVVGLWGMTGTGKSSLVRALTTHLGLADKTFWLDAGGCRKRDWLDEVLERVRAHHDGQPFVLVVDEFQHARTVKNGDERDEPAELRRLWEMMDSGRAMVELANRHWLRELLDLEDKLRALLRQDVVIANGRVVQGMDTFNKVMESHRSEENWAIPEGSWDWLRDIMPKPISLTVFREQLEKLDGHGVLRMLRDLVDSCIAPAPLDASRALVIVLGNLDELYASGRDPMPELDPEVLLRRHQRIGTTGVHEALCGLFRIEQVARLGTDHIVFPPMGGEAVQTLVRSEAEALLARLTEVCGIALSVTPALLARIEQEATIAVLGARPVVAAVHRVLPALATELCERLGDRRPPHGLLDHAGGRAVARMQAEGRTEVMSLKWPIPPSPEKDPVAMRRYAVHEAGHLVCGVRLARLTPLQACARTTSDRVGGFVIWEQERLLTAGGLLPRLAGMLGGWAAERLIYGEAGVSMGSNDDLHKATGLALDAVKEHGFGSERIYRAEHASAPITGFRTLQRSAEMQAQQWVQEAEELALRTLRDERELLERVTDALVKHGSLGPSAIERLFAEDAHLAIGQHA
ncbi:MAG: AAA family ATPase [Flavobacteriales bacterium]|jgi:cell division protease FtsH|nr:AAA family ATPase [Flavobacteriales bacterium]